MYVYSGLQIDHMGNPIVCADIIQQVIFILGSLDQLFKNIFKQNKQSNKINNEKIFCGKLWPNKNTLVLYFVI